MAIGITDNGFVIETLDEIRTDMANRLNNRWGTNISFDNESAAGHLVGIVAERFAKLQELAEAIFRSFSRDTAVAEGLVNMNTLTGTLPKAAFASSVILTLTGVPATSVLASKQAETADGVIFQTQVNATIATVPARTTSTVYPLGAFRTNAGNIYVVTVAGTTGVGSGPSSTAGAISDGGVTWRFVGAGTGMVNVKSIATETGPLRALSGSVNLIKTPVSGWNGVLNLLDADEGADKESDESYRLRGLTEVFAAGSHTADAIRADILRLTGVLSVRVLQNQTDLTDADGMPPHTVEALVRGGDDTEIATYLLETGIGAGYASFGNTPVVLLDDLGVSYTIKFSRPVQLPIYTTLNVIVDPGNFPADGTDQIKLAVVTWGDAQDTGRDAVAAAIAAQAFTVDGVLDVPSVQIGLAPSPTSSTTLVVPLRSLAVYDTSRIVVNVTNGTP